jgi:integrase/recombinase XerD
MKKNDQRQLALIPINSPQRNDLPIRQVNARPDSSLVSKYDHSGCQDDDALVELFLQTRTQSSQSQRVYRYELTRFLAFIQKPLGRITLADLQDFATELEALDLATATRSRAIATIRSLLRFAHETGYLPFDVGRALRTPKKSESSGQRYLTPGEAERLLDAARERSLRDLLVVAVLLGTGLRCAELAGANWGDIYADPENRLGLRVRGKGGKERDVKIRADLWDVIIAERDNRGKYTELNPTDNAPLVVNRSRDRLSERGVHRVIVSCGKAAGLRKSISPHWLRHTHATLSLQAGASILQIREALGHSSLATSSIYLHAVRGLSETAADHLPVRFDVGDRKEN